MPIEVSFHENYYISETVNEPMNVEELPKEMVLFRAILTKAIKGVKNGFIHWKKNSLTAINVSPLLLLREFYGAMKKYGGHPATFFAAGRTFLQIKDTFLIYRLNGGYLNDPNNYDEQAWIDWADKYGICYEMVVPDSLKEEMKNELIEKNLRMYFREVYNADFAIEKKSVKCLVLKKITQDDKLISKGGTSQENYEFYSIVVNNTYFKRFFTSLYSFYRDNLPMIDETQYEGKIDININCKITDYKVLNKELEKYGLYLFPEERVIDVLVIKDN